jgi:hypothetical protein
MIRYSDYNGPQDDVGVRDGHVVPFDRDAAHEMAQQAHVLASDVSPVTVARMVARLRETARASRLRAT